VLQADSAGSALQQSQRSVNGPRASAGASRFRPRARQTVRPWNMHPTRTRLARSRQTHRYEAVRPGPLAGIPSDPGSRTRPAASHEDAALVVAYIGALGARGTLSQRRRARRQRPRLMSTGKWRRLSFGMASGHDERCGQRAAAAAGNGDWPSPWCRVVPTVHVQVMRVPRCGYRPAVWEGPLL
jgi:hypothetical protein